MAILLFLLPKTKIMQPSKVRYTINKQLETDKIDWLMLLRFQVLSYTVIQVCFYVIKTRKR